MDYWGLVQACFRSVYTEHGVLRNPYIGMYIPAHTIVHSSADSLRDISPIWRSMETRVVLRRVSQRPPDVHAVFLMVCNRNLDYLSQMGAIPNSASPSRSMATWPGAGWPNPRGAGL